MNTESPQDAAALVFRTRTTPEQAAAEKKIRMGWGAALASAGITAVFSVVAMLGKSLAGVTAFSILDVLLLLGLAFGMHRRSRTCAVILLAYFLLSKVLQYMVVSASATGRISVVSGIPMALIFIYLYTQGVIGTFAWHRLRRTTPPELPASAP